MIPLFWYIVAWGQLHASRSDNDKELPQIIPLIPGDHSVIHLSRYDNIMDFAPYQDQSPEIERALSPPHADGHRISPILRSPRASADLPSPSHFAGGGHGNTGFGRDVEGGHVSLGAFETSLPIRMDIEAALAYLLLPPAGGVFLLLAEHKSDYVRYVMGFGLLLGSLKPYFTNYSL